MKAKVHSIETFGAVDGPGIRFVVFLKGCRLRCRFCHNPDTWSDHGADLMEADELLDRAERYRNYWGSSGGITVSGGEPLLQMDFLIDFFTKAKKRGISTCIDTAGEPFTREEPWFSQFRRLMDVTDLLLMDIKQIDREAHIRLTGKPNDNIFDMFRYLSDTGKPIWIRKVLVPGWTDSDEELQKEAAFIRTLTNVQRVDVLPYHTMGLYKWQELGIPYPLEGVKPPTDESVRHAEEVLTGALQKTA